MSVSKVNIYGNCQNEMMKLVKEIRSVAYSLIVYKNVILDVYNRILDD